MAKHATLTPKSKKLIAAFAASGLVGTGLAVPMGQMAMGNGDPCLVTSDGAPGNQATLRSAIDAAIANVTCQTVTINHTVPGTVLDLEVSTTPIYIGPSSLVTDTRSSLTLKTTTGLTIQPASGDPGELFVLQDSLSSLQIASPTFSFPNVFTSINIEGITLQDASSPAIDGSSFAASLSILDSTFMNNDASFGGGAIYSAGSVFISNSLFKGNASANAGGGAVRAPSIYAVNSTFLNNANTGPGDKSGALRADGVLELALNTFDGNSGSAYNNTGFTKIWGNIFANNDSTTIQTDGGATVTDLGYNLFTKTIGAPQAASSEEVTYSEIAFGSGLLPTSITPGSGPKTQVRPLTNGSVAVDFVQAAFPAGFNAFFNGKTGADQQGTTRTADFDAGAQEFGSNGNQAPPSGNGGSYSAPSAPSTPVATTAQDRARTVVPGFASNSVKLNKPMRKEIRKFLRANPNLNNVVCKGFTSAPATAQDRMLARERGKVTCAFIKKLRPEANVTLRSGSHTDRPGLQIRRVQITLR